MKLTASQSTGVGAGALIYCKSTGKLLLALRSEKCDAPNTWCCFGGGVERGETLVQGVRREFREEFGISLDCPLYHIHISHLADKQGNTMFTYHNFLGIVEEPFSGTLNDEHTEWGWFSGSKLPQPLHPEFREALATTRAQLLLTSLKGI